MKFLPEATIKAFLAVLVTLVASGPNCLASSDGHRTPSFTVLNYETGWSHDGAGYHPAIFLLMENTSGRDLSDKTVKFQARFTDLETTEVTIGRHNMRSELKPNQQFRLDIEGREASNGMEGFELPFEVSYWPKLETKVMCRVGDVTDEGTETLLITKLEAQTRSKEEAFQNLNQSSSFNHHTIPTAPPRPSSRQTEPARAKALSYGAKSNNDPSTNPDKNRWLNASTGTNQQTHSTQHGDANASMRLLNGKPLPGLGDDFYNFEQRFGLPVTIDTKTADWTWAKYHHAGSGTDLLAGSKQRTGKVDVIIFLLPKPATVDLTTLVGSAKQVSGPYRSQTLSTPVKSVRYLSSGRLELVTTKASSYHAMSLAPATSTEPDSPGLILVVSRMPQNLEPLLAGLSHKSSLLKQFKFLDNGS